MTGRGGGGEGGDEKTDQAPDRFFRASVTHVRLVSFLHVLQSSTSSLRHTPVFFTSYSGVFTIF